MQEFDSIPLLKEKNPKIFGSRFNIVDKDTLPAPEGLNCKFSGLFEYWFFRNKSFQYDPVPYSTYFNS